MILSNAALNWASLRSGMPLHEFLAVLTPEREQEILVAYNSWRCEKGLPEDKPVPFTPSTPPPAKRKESAIEQFMEQIAVEVEKEQEEDAILIGETMRVVRNTPVDWAPEKITTMDDDPSMDIDEGADMATAEKEPAAPAVPRVDIDEGTDMAVPEEPAATEPGSQAEEDRFDRLSAIASTLPKQPDPTLYQSILFDLGCSVGEAKAVAEDVRRYFTSKHRGTAGIRTFLEWLGE